MNKVWRTTGCRIREITINGVECVVLENERIRVGIAASKGTDIYELVYKPQDVDVMWHGVHPLGNVVTERHALGGMDNSFLDYYEGGWQELFPGIGGPSTVANATIGIHGEVWGLPWEYQILCDTEEEVAVHFQVQTVRLPFLLEKTIRLRRNSAQLVLEERVTNLGNVRQQFMWGHHPAFGAPFLDESCHLEMPEGTKIRTRDEDSAERHVLQCGQISKYPMAKCKDGSELDVSKALPPDGGRYLEFLLTGFEQGRYRLISDRLQLAVQMEWDASLFPYVWVWAPDCTMDFSPWFCREYTFAVEPWSSFPDNLEEAIKARTALELGPQETIATMFQVTIQDTNPEHGGQ